MKRALLATALIAVIATIAWGETSLAGNWTVEWLSQDNASYNPPVTNPITLTNDGKVIGGTYVNDAGETCPVTGSVYVSDNSRMTDFAAKCPTWRIDFSGSVVDDLTIKGNYSVSGGKYGKGYMSRFGMKKNECLLPEGCPDKK